MAEIELVNDAQVANNPNLVESAEVSDGTRFARNRMLDELPGLVFGLMTIIYIVMSLAGLAP